MSNPLKINWRTEWFSAGLLILSIFLGVYFYQHFPATVPIHWNWQGEVDSYGSAAFGAFLLPGVMLVMYLLFLVLPYFDPKKERYADFVEAYHNFKDLLIIFFFSIFWLTGLAGLGYDININLALPIILGLLFIGLGSLLRKIKMNWFLGIRTPWTLSSEEVWNKTHRAAGPVFMISGLLIILTSFIEPCSRIILFILAILSPVIGLPAYSYILFRREKNKK